MVSRENRAILGSFVLFALAVVALIYLENNFGVSLQQHLLLVFFIFAGLTVVLPQLYLARTDDEISPRTRVRFAVIMTGIFAAMFAGDTHLEDGLGWYLLSDLEALQGVLVIGIAVAAFVGLVCYEFVAGFRSNSDSADDAATRP